MKYVFKVSMLLMCLSPLCAMDTDDEDEYGFITHDGHTDDLVTRAEKAFNKLKCAYELASHDQEVPGFDVIEAVMFLPSKASTSCL